MSLGQMTSNLGDVSYRNPKNPSRGFTIESEKAREMVAGDDYKFLDIKDAIASINQKVDLIGVVIEFGFPKRSRGTDCFCNLKIVDESYHKSGISVNIFAENLEKISHVASAGDIIQLSRVVMKTHAGESFAVFNKKFSSFALYEGGDGKDFVPYQVSSSFRPRDLDKKFIARLREWMVDFYPDEGSAKFSFVKEIKEGQRMDLISKIVYVCEDAADGWMGFIWDGTDAKPSSIYQKLADDKDNILPLETMPLARDLLCTLPPVGTILRLIVDQGIEKNSLRMLGTGKWVKFVNVVIEVQDGLYHVVLTPSSKLRYTQDGDPLVVFRNRLYNERLTAKLGRIPLWSFPWPSPITEIDYEHKPFVTLREILTYPEVTGKFKCVVRVIAIFPCLAADFRSPTGIYRVRLTLEDPTARIHAFVYGDDGEYFFDGHPPIEVLRQKRNHLLGVTASSEDEEIVGKRDPPWVACCLKSYYGTKSDIWGSRRYQIFGTKVVW